MVSPILGSHIYNNFWGYQCMRGREENRKRHI